MIFVEKISISQKSANCIQKISENFNIVIVIAIHFNIEEIHDITSMVQKSFIVFSNYVKECKIMDTTTNKIEDAILRSLILWALSLGQP